MKNIASVLFAFVLLASFAFPAIAQDEQAPAPQAQEDQMAEPVDEDMQEDGEAIDDDSPMCRMAGGDGCCMKAEKPAGCMCGPDCQCPDCPMKKGGMGMGMKHGSGMDGMHGDIDMMTRPRMNRSCRMPDQYLKLRDHLNLGENQVASLKKLNAAMKKEAILKGAQVKVLELELSEIVTATDFKVNDAVAKLKEVEAARLDLRTAMIKIAGGARDVLSPEQLDKIKDLGMGGMRGSRGGMKKMMMEKMMHKNMGQ